MDNENILRVLMLLNDILEDKNMMWNNFRKILFPRTQDKTAILINKNEIIKKWFELNGGIIEDSTEDKLINKTKKVLTDEDRQRSRESYRNNIENRNELLLSWRERNYKGKFK